MARNTLEIDGHNINNLKVSSKFADFKIQEIIPTSVELKLLI